MTNFSPDSVGLTELIDRILDKGLIINADIKIDLVGTEILGIKIRAALASFETAARFGLSFPAGTNLNAPAWEELGIKSEFCPSCGNQVLTKAESVCSCGWKKTIIKQGEKQIEVAKNESYNQKYKTETHRPNLEKA